MVAIKAASCDEAETQLSLSNESSETLLERASYLCTIITLARFTLDESEIEALMSRDIPIGQQFFDAMDKQNVLEKTVAFLWQVRMDQQKRGEFVMVVSFLTTPLYSSISFRLKVGNYGLYSTSLNLEQGYEKLLRYCSNGFCHIGRDFQLKKKKKVSNGLQEAVVRL